jgi:hypothetical protein
MRERVSIRERVNKKKRVGREMMRKNKMKKEADFLFSFDREESLMIAMYSV